MKFNSFDKQTAALKLPLFFEIVGSVVVFNRKWTSFNEVRQKLEDRLPLEISPIVTTALGKFGSVAERRRGALLPSEIFLHQVDQIFFKEHAFIADLDSLCYRENSRAFTEEHLRYKTRSQLYFDNSISLASA